MKAKKWSLKKKVQILLREIETHELVQIGPTPDGPKPTIIVCDSLSRVARKFKSYLKVVKTQAILFLKSMSERGGSDLNDSEFDVIFNRFEVVLEIHYSSS